MLLYDSAVSGNCYKVRLLLAHLGLPYERHELDVVDRSSRPEVLGGLNPSLRVPTIVLDDGRAIGESGAILWYFGEGTAFVPADRWDRAQMLQWMFFEQYDLEPSIAVVRFWLHVLGGVPEGQEAAYEAKLAASHKTLAAMERSLSDGREWFVGDAMSLADIALYGYTHVAHEGGFEMAGYPETGRWLHRVAAMPGHVPIDA